MAKSKAKKPVDLFAVLILGLVMSDAELIEQKLRGAVRKTPADYRGDLRVIIGAAVRIKERCTRLLHEDDAAPTSRGK